MIRVVDLTIEPDGQPNRVGLATFSDIDISRDGRFLAIAATRDLVDPNRDYKFLSLWSLEENREVRRMHGHSDRLTSILFAPDGVEVATGSHDRTIRIWDVETGQTVRTFAGHEGAVLGIAYSPSGTEIASASADQTVKIWNSRTGENQQTLVGHQSAVTRVVFTRDGENVISASEDGELRFWPIGLSDEPFTLRQHSGAVQALAAPVVTRSGSRRRGLTGRFSFGIWRTFARIIRNLGRQWL